MKDQDKTREQLISELIELRHRNEYMQKAAQEISMEREHRYYSIIENSIDGIVLTDENGTIIEWNNGMRMITGLDREKVIGCANWDVVFMVMPEEKKNYSLYNRLRASTMEMLSKGKTSWSGKYIEGEIRQPDGSVRYIQDISCPVKADKGFMFCSIIRDITDKKRLEKKLEENREQLEENVKKRTEKLRKANVRLNREIKKRKLIEEALWENQRRYETLLEILPVGLYQADSDGRCVYVNDLSSRLLGLSQDDLSNCSWMKALHPDDRVQVTAELLRCADRRNNFKMKFRFLTSGQNVAWVLGQAVPFLGHNNKFLGYLFTFSDITDLKLAEGELKDSEERYRRLVELSPCVIAVHSEGRIVFINRLGAKLYGLENPDELIGKPLMDFVHPDYRPLVYERVRLMLEEGKNVLPPVEERLILADGTVKDVEVAAAPFIFKNKPAIQLIAQDITERKSIEHALRLSEERFLKAFNASPDPTVISTFDDGTIVEINNSFLYVTGFSREEVIGKTSQELNLCVYPDTFMQAYKKTIEQGFIHNHEIYIRTKTGKQRFGLFSTDIISVDRERYLIGIFHDLTRRKEAEDALRESSRLMNSVFDSIQDHLSVIDTEFNIIRINSKVKQLFSHLPLEGEKCHKVFHGNDHICEGCPSLKALKTGRSAHAVLQLAWAGEDKKIWEEHYSYPFIDQKTGEIRGIIVYSRNITDRVKVEKEMARLERLNLIGEMAASIGHEVRNPMTTVRGFLQMLGEKRDWGIYREYFNIMIEELDRANNIITEFLSLARNKPVDLKIISLNTILRSLSLLMAANGINSNVDVALELGDIPDVSLNEKEIRQLILNLVRNGLEAMNDGGKLTIKTYLENGEVVLAVQDQGQGIKADLLDKVGTPFFTTKEEGTGLGLAVCYGIADRHNATITMETGPSGTEFFVRFKLCN